MIWNARFPALTFTTPCFLCVEFASDTVYFYFSKWFPPVSLLLLKYTISVVLLPLVQWDTAMSHRDAWSPVQCPWLEGSIFTQLFLKSAHLPLGGTIPPLEKQHLNHHKWLALENMNSEVGLHPFEENKSSRVSILGPSAAAGPSVSDEDSLWPLQSPDSVSKSVQSPSWLLQKTLLCEQWEMKWEYSCSARLKFRWWNCVCAPCRVRLKSSPSISAGVGWCVSCSADRLQ